MLDESTRPKRFDWVKFIGPDSLSLEPIPGTHEFKGGGLTLCNGASGGVGPTEFKAGDGDPPHLMVLNRDQDASNPR